MENSLETDPPDFFGLTPAEKARNARLVRLYGLTSAEYDTILAHQGGGCAICGRPPASRRLHVDHDHKTGVTRGLLDFACNSMLRRRITPELLRSAADYLERNPATEALGREVVGQTGRISKKRRRRR